MVPPSWMENDQLVSTTPDGKALPHMSSLAHCRDLPPSLSGQGFYLGGRHAHQDIGVSKNVIQ